MNVHSLPKLTTRSHKRLGRGHGSGRGKTAGRGTKGQNARGSMPPHFEGGQLSVMKRLPFLRGKLRNKSRSEKPSVLPVSALDQLADSTSPITLEVLKKHGLVDAHSQSVKILGGATLKAKLTVSVPCSAGARKAIEKAGGVVSTSTA